MKVLCASDKFRGTATVAQIGDVVAAAARDQGWESRTFPVSDGGEGFLDAMGGKPVEGVVAGPLGTPVTARWHRLDEATAVLEVAQAAGLLTAGGAAGNDPVNATTYGVGQQVLDAVRCGARRILIGCGGSATTDGGTGLVRAIQAGGGLPPGVELVAATDVRTTFLDAARIFGPQKGADPATVELLTGRLETVAQEFLDRFGVDVREVPGSGAAGGLGGAVVALGGRVEPGFDVVARAGGFDAELAAADLVVTGEGRLDETSLAGKVVGEVLRRSGERVPVQIVVGSADPEVVRELGDRGVGVTVLADRFGLDAALSRTLDLLAEVVPELLSGAHSGVSRVNHTTLPMPAS